MVIIGLKVLRVGLLDPGPLDPDLDVLGEEYEEHEVDEVSYTQGLALVPLLLLQLASDLPMSSRVSKGEPRGSRLGYIRSSSSLTQARSENWFSW